MGSVFSSILGGSQPSYDMPEYEPTPIITNEQASEPVAKAVRDEQRRRIRSRRAGMNGTLLSGRLAQPTLLGGNLQSTLLSSTPE